MDRLILEVGSITEVSNLSVEELDPYVGKEVGRKVHGFFNRSLFDD